MVFSANCIRPVYVVRSYGSSPHETDYLQVELFHDPNSAQAAYQFNKLCTGAEKVTLTIETLKFDGWRVVG